MIQLIAKKSKRLLSLAKEIFGEWEVDNVYVLGEYYSLSQTYENALAEIQKDENDAIMPDEIDIGAKDIVIEFANGAFVKFESSEWGSISKADRNKFDIIE